MSQRAELIDHIDHHAVVEKVNLQESEVTVRVIAEEKEGCTECPAGVLCGAKGNDLLVIRTTEAAKFHPGEKVVIRGTEQMHRKAIMLATVIPCIALVVVMAGIYLLTLDQLLSALCGIGATLLFYLLIYVCRNKIAHEFNFTIHHL